MKVLSCFDGMSCGQIALERADIPVKKYYASEIDKYAMQVTQANYPDTIQLGSITEWRSWNIEQPGIIIGGSPCQGFSFAGKQLNFEDDRSKLFFTFIEILKHYKPKYFLLENVIMKKEYNDVISGILGELYPECVEQTELFRTGRLEPIEINSALVSAQNRRRLYWTNISGITQPEDKGILLKDIIESGEADREKSYCIDANYGKGGNLKRYFKRGSRQLIFNNAKCIQVGEADIKGNDQIKRVYSTEGKSPCISTCQGGNREPKIAVKDSIYNNRDSIIYKEKGLTPRSGRFGLEKTTDNITWRKLTPIECERLQTVPDNYTNHVSNSQRYKMLGNGWTVDVIKHIFSHIPHNRKNPCPQSQ